MVPRGIKIRERIYYWKSLVQEVLRLEINYQFSWDKGDDTGLKELAVPEE